MFDEQNTIIAAPSAGLEQLVAGLLLRPTGAYTTDDIRGTIVPAYLEICLPVGVDPTLALAQMIHETDNLGSFWAARPRRNPAGIGVNGRKQPDQPADPSHWSFNPVTQLWESGNSFGSWKDDAVPAQIGRLLAYALPKGSETPAQAALIGRALGYRPLPDVMRGSAPVLKLLGKHHNPTGQGWASPGDEYGLRIARTALRLVNV